MKLKIIFLSVSILASFSFNTLNAQDLIVTKQGDSLNSKITRVKTDFIYFTFKYNDEVRNTQLPVSNVKYYKKNFYQVGELPTEERPEHKNYQSFRFAINSGYSYLTAKLADEVTGSEKTLLEELRSGYHFGSDFTYFFSEELGFGAKYLLFKSSSNIGGLNTSLSHTFIGPSFSVKLTDYNKKNNFIINFAIGYMGHNNSISSTSFVSTASTIGIIADVGHDLELSKNLSLGFQLSAIAASLSKFKLSDGITSRTFELEDGKRESLNRLDFSIGLRYHN